MKCPYCHSDTKVTNSRSRQKGTHIWRRRQCVSCGSIWTTHEKIDLTTTHKVINREKHLQPFSRDKLFISLQDSLRHRKTALRDSTELTDTVLQRILAQKSAKISILDIIKITHGVLKNFDTTAASVYLSSTKL